MRITMVDLLYAYGKQRPFLNGSLVAATARLRSGGHDVTYVDYNIDSEEAVLKALRSAEAIGVSVYGSPYIPVALKFARRMFQTGVPILVGGQAAQNLTREQFAQIFAGTHAVQIADDHDLALATNTDVTDYVSPQYMDLSYGYRLVPEHYWPMYMRGEMPLFVSRGCAYRCMFCAAEKERREEHVLEGPFCNSLSWLVAKAVDLNINTLWFYASSLDFFQEPNQVKEHLRVVGEIAEAYDVRIRLRALTCLRSFLNANAILPNFANLVRRAGLWSLGFGVDGADDTVWRAQRKRQNKLPDVHRCLDLCEALGIRPEILLVMGFPEDTATSLFKNFVSATRYVWKWPTTMLRPYLAKAYVPGNSGWRDNAEVTEQLVAEPELFYNLDFAAVGSRITHPHRTHRYLSNATYLGLIALFTPFGNCNTPPFLPQGDESWLGRFARAYNRFLPSDP